LPNRIATSAGMNRRERIEHFLFLINLFKEKKMTEAAIVSDARTAIGKQQRGEPAGGRSGCQERLRRASANELQTSMPDSLHLVVD
jgi:hypothetical protein